ncbi:GDP dissociation inhibitor, putative [Plasmodium ovale]|uniref:GDP dissociation inhibitor, putative n=2 Tax=Plasmodium ovale TaxID=36330 RepID=A0A1A8VQ08_PLAOA|nr:GDP dissociation inhibitor, putative [Plasmodium ovale curtisi]SBS84522.1 GDP dissociation inhibitor, putative [Plasmodium ovale curtisi]SCP04003.1 GDP dissociation inhibitor, putative [Plasmodium ovale]
MDDEKGTTCFNCDILICGTSLLNTLLSVYFSINNYKVIHIDKNNYYGDVNCSLTFDQFQDEKKNLHNFYEEYFPLSSNLNDEKKKKLLGEVMQNYFQINNNKFNVDLNPKILYNESNIVSLLVSLNAHAYINFVGIQNFYLTYKKDITPFKGDCTNEEEQKEINDTGEKETFKGVNSMRVNKDLRDGEEDLILLKIPLNKSQVFLDTNLNLCEKRMIMNFIYKNIVHDRNYTFSSYSNYNFAKGANVMQHKCPLQSGKRPSQEITGDTANNHFFEKDIYKCSEKNPYRDEKEELTNVNILDYLKIYNITNKIRDYIIYGIGLFDLELGNCNDKSISEYYLSGYTKEKNFIMNKKEFLQRLHILINSLNKFKSQNLFENAFIYPTYGLNDIIYAISRVACLNNAIYMINRKIQNIIFSDFYLNGKENMKNRDVSSMCASSSVPASDCAQIEEIVLDNGYIIRPKFVISSSSNINFYEMKKYLFSKNRRKKTAKKGKIQIVTNRLIVLSTYSLLGKNGLSFYIHKQPNFEQDKKKHAHNLDTSVHILQLDYGSGSCPSGFFLTYFTSLSIKKQQNENSPSSTSINCTKEKDINYQDSCKQRNKKENKQKPINFLLLFDVLKLYIKKHRDTTNAYVGSNLPHKLPFSEKFWNKVIHLFNSDQIKGAPADEISKMKKAENGEIGERIEVENCHPKSNKDGTNGQYDKTGEVSNEQSQRDEARRKSLTNSFNELLTNEGVIYFAYYEYKPVVYRKDTIKLISRNMENYKKILENIEKSSTKEHLGDKEKVEKRENEKNILNKMNPDNNNNSDVDVIKKNSEQGKNENMLKQIITHNHSHKNSIVGLEEDKNICNLLFTNDTHNYPIYPMIEDVSTFFYIINKIHKTFLQPNHIQTLYDTYNDIIKTQFSHQTKSTI